VLGCLLFCFENPRSVGSSHFDSELISLGALACEYSGDLKPIWNLAWIW
jgi:hypothetical protein